MFKRKAQDWDWKGAKCRRFRLLKFRFEYGRACYRTNFMGVTLASGWEWEKK